MRPHSLLWFPLSIALVGCASVRTHAPESPAAAGAVRSTARNGIADYEIDALTLQPAVKRAFGMGQDVRIVVTQTNPFIHEYRLTARNQPIAEASIGDFFKDVLKISLPTVTAQPATEITLTGPNKLRAFTLGFGGCSAPASTAASEINVRREALSALHTAIRSRFARIEGGSGRADSALAVHRAVFMHPRSDSASVAAAARAAAGALRQFTGELGTEMDVLNRDVPSYAANVRDLMGAAAAVASKHGDCPGAQEAALQTARFVADTAVFKASLAAVTTKFQAVKSEPDRLLGIANDHRLFSVTGMLDRYHRPTDVTVVVLRRALGSDAEFQTLTSQRINFGGRARWSFSGGLAISTLAQRDYGLRTQRIAASPANAGDTLASVIVETQSSEATVLPMVTFNTRLTARPGAFNPQLVLGVGLNAADQTRVGFLTGLGVDAFGERVVLSIGYLFAEERSLAGGLEAGDRVFGANGLIERKDMVGRPAFSLTYRVF